MAAPADRRLLTFRSGGQRFSLPTALVREVARLPRLSRVPNAPKALLGLANLRGTVVPILSLAELMDRQAGTARRVIVVDAGEPVGLAVDDVDEVADAGSGGASPIDVPSLISRAISARPDRRSGAATLVATAGQAHATERLALVTFSVAGQAFALPAPAIDEIMRVPGDIARLPHAESVVLGSTLLRGKLLPLLSLAALLALPAPPVTTRSRILVVAIGRHRVGLLVDMVGEIQRVPESDIDPVPHVLTRGGAEARIQAICRLDDGRRLVSILAADQLLREDITTRLLQGGAGNEDDMAQQGTAEASEQFLLFRIGAEEFGLPIVAVEEVAPLPARLTALPRAPGFVQGVMNLRGQVIPVIDQALRFGGSSAAGTRRRVIVMRVDDLLAGFVVDAASEVLRIPSQAIRETPDLGDDARVFDRVANLAGEQRIILIVSPRELLDRAERDLLASFAGAGAAAPS